jgi:hypothetical protein
LILCEKKSAIKVEKILKESDTYTLFFLWIQEVERGFGAVLRRKIPMWPFSQKIARLEYCAPFQKRSKTRDRL